MLLLPWKKWLPPWLLRPLSVMARLGLCIAVASCAAVKAPNDPSFSLDSFPPMAAGAAPGASEQAWAVAKSLGRGVNFGNMLEAPTEGAWGIRVEDSFYDKVVEAGFQSVRLPVRWSNHASLDAQAHIDEGFGKRVDAVIDELLKRHLTVIVNMHHYRQLDGDALDSGARRASLAGRAPVQPQAGCDDRSDAMEQREGLEPADLAQ
ncbi:hypothetical protein DZC73_05815 [Albitalea terrae]|uniref:Glycoside hydrolase family 5 domain-containing protein n=1 Tax=Piscinibacter terrae TaxID=2496871 RepID=A0A3N7HZH3_9BURK|nr:hypothetical protein DZC73_05815 [Albitalea terrae]